MFAVVLAALAGGGFVFVKIQEAARHSRELDQLFVDVGTVVEKGDRQDPELSRLVAKLEGLDQTERRVAVALARIDVLRGRFDQALRRLDVHLMGGTSEVEERTAAIAYLECPLRGGANELERRSMWRKAREHAELAYAKSGQVEDLFRAWQAASRIGDDDASARLAAQLQREHPQSREARAVTLLLGSQVEMAAVEELALEWDEPPIELELARNALLLIDKQFEVAARRFDALLTRAPNLLSVRHFAALALDQYAAILPEGPARERQRQLRDAQLEWLDANADVGDPRRGIWAALRGRG